MTHSYRKLSANKLKPFGSLQQEKYHSRMDNVSMTAIGLCLKKMRMRKAMTDPHDD
jgi:hypothetical protein